MAGITSFPAYLLGTKPHYLRCFRGKGTVIPVAVGALCCRGSAPWGQELGVPRESSWAEQGAGVPTSSIP